MNQTVAAYEGRVAKVVGSARSGKTEALVSRCATLLARGVKPETILVEVSSTLAADAFRERLRKAIDAKSHSSIDTLTVRSPLSLCCRELSSPQAIAATGRTPRLLNDAEYNFVLEDMKTLGLPIRRLRKMLSYFFVQWAMLEAPATWSTGADEEAILEHLVSLLAWRGAMLRQEAPFLCAEYLKSEAGASSRRSFDYVLCDDFQNMSQAEQTCLCLLANRQLIVCGNPNQTTAIGTRHPHPQGFDEFERLRRDVDVFEFSAAYGNPAVTAFANALCDCGDMDPALRANEAMSIDARDERDILLIKWNTPEEELDGMARYLRAAFDAERGRYENRTCVLVPTRRWARELRRLLSKRGFSVSNAGAAGGLGGDPRDSSRAQALVAYTKLNLLARPDDMVAWRSWCGLDNHLTNSDVWNNLQDYARQHGLAPYAALKRVATTATAGKMPFLRANVLTERWGAGRKFIEENSGRRGFSLLEAIGANSLVEFEDAARAMDGDEDAGHLFGIVQTMIDYPSFPADPHTLHVVAYDCLCGIEYDTIYAIGTIDGFMPRRDAFEVISTDAERRRVMDSERRLFYGAITKANKHLVLSYFVKASLEVAERTKMQVVRIRAEDGERMAVIRPSAFITETGDACPGSVGAQSVLAGYDIA
jgi:DNA helicase-2/ATP-dependent DNA helicase PcrA